MNLKTFHLVFISCSCALAFLFGAWVLNDSTLEGFARLATGFGAFVVALALIAYETWFLRYSKRTR
jgi:hypothetical protein